RPAPRSPARAGDPAGRPDQSNRHASWRFSLFYAEGGSILEAPLRGDKGHVRFTYEQVVFG
ncbi:hypothetical protein, partial [Pseudomonas brassicae]|uniref:hypothetical protein n=1 Tax=Pseudomonas brassicae TaxID=2708063 RepID=UPI001FB52BA0